jgi:hypothetical protein
MISRMPPGEVEKLSVSKLLAMGYKAYCGKCYQPHVLTEGKCVFCGSKLRDTATGRYLDEMLSAIDYR